MKALRDPHRHVTDVSRSSLRLDLRGQIDFVEVAPPDGRNGSKELANPKHSFVALTYCDDKCVVLVREVASMRFFEIQVPSFSPARPFQGVLWLGQNILVFDQRTQPSYGIHYAVDVKARTLLQASPFSSLRPF